MIGEAAGTRTKVIPTSHLLCSTMGAHPSIRSFKYSFITWSGLEGSSGDSEMNRDLELPALIAVPWSTVIWFSHSNRVRQVRKRQKVILSVVSSSGEMLTSRWFLEVFLHVLATCNPFRVAVNSSLCWTFLRYGRLPPNDMGVFQCQILTLCRIRTYFLWLSFISECVWLHKFSEVLTGLKNIHF